MGVKLVTRGNEDTIGTIILSKSLDLTNSISQFFTTVKTRYFSIQP
jgi:hypothetical protein